MLGLFFNPWTADNKCFLLNRDNWSQQFAFCKFRFNFENLQKKDDPHSWCIFELMDSKKRG